MANCYHFEVGDIVIVHKPEDPHEYPGWNMNMDSFVGIELAIKEIRGIKRDIVKLEGDNNRWIYNVKWLELVEEDININLNDEELQSFINTFIK